MLTFALTALALTAPGIDELCRTPPPVIFAPGPEYGSEARKYQGIPGIERAPNGRLWAVWYAGKIHEDQYNYVVGVTSGDDGRTWSDLKFVIDPDGDGPLRASDPCLWLAPSGRLWLFWFQNGGGAIPALFAMTTDNPGDEQPTWTKPRFLHDGIMMCKPIVTRNGDWLLPTAIWGREQSCRVVASSDRGQTWSLRGAASVPARTDRDCDEPMMVERRDGSLWMLVRTRYGLGETVSTDSGRTWSPVAQAKLAHATSRCYLRRLASGRLLLVKHGPLAERIGRTHLTAYLSDDDGATWQGGLLLDERATVSYPDGTQAPDGRIMVIYDWNRADQKHLLMAVFTEADVLAGKPVSGQTRFRQLINHATGLNPKPWLKDERRLNLQPHADAAPLLTGPAATLQPVAGEVREIALGAAVFGNRKYAWHAVPAALARKRFVFASMDRAEAVCRDAGVVYVLTPTAARNQDSVERTLLAQGFQKAAVPEFVLFLGADGGVHPSNVCTVYQKQMAAGETVKFGKWGVIVF